MKEWEHLVQTVARLRAEDGCPWDRVQTHESLKPEVVEEAAEVVCGINILRETGDPENLKEELGDLLLQVLFHAQIAEEDGLFTIADVLSGVDRKMIRRHPHVFGEEAAERAWRQDAAAPDAGEETPAAPVPDTAGETPGAAPDAGEKPADPELSRWEQIKKREKAGREWESAYLRDAFEEASDLILRAKKRKGF